MTISIVIPNFNGRELLSKYLPGVVMAKKIKKNNIKEIIIVDDFSSDDSINFLKDNFSKEIKILRHSKNQGFAASVNDGAKAAKGDLICLINNDVSVSKNFLSKIQKNFKDPEIFAVSLHEKGYGPALGKFIKGFVEHSAGKESENIENTFWASGGSAIFRNDIWKKLGGMDQELFPFYWEDVDISFRAQKRGLRILWDPDALVVHKHESTYKKLDQRYVQRIRERNQLLFIWKNITSGNLIKKHVFALIKRIIFHPGYLIILFLALKKLNLVLKRRKVELKEGKVSDEAIFARFN